MKEEQMKRILFYGLILSVIILNACSGEKRDDGSTEVKIIMNGEFNRVPEGINKSEQKVSQYTYNLLLKITAPDLSEPLIFLNPDYQPGTQWTVLVPNGTARTFELIEYTVFDSISYNYFNFSQLREWSAPNAACENARGQRLRNHLSGLNNENPIWGCLCPKLLWHCFKGFSC